MDYEFLDPEGTKELIKLIKNNSDTKADKTEVQAIDEKIGNISTILDQINRKEV